MPSNMTYYTVVETRKLKGDFELGLAIMRAKTLSSMMDEKYSVIRVSVEKTFDCGEECQAEICLIGEEAKNEQ